MLKQLHGSPILRRIELVCWPHDRVCDRTWLLENVKGAAGAVVMLTDKVDKEFIEAAGDSLKVISTMSVGYDHVDLQACKEKGIRVGHSE